MYQKRIKILIIDDVAQDVEKLKCHLLPVMAGDNLFKEEIIAKIDEIFSIDVRHSVPDALEYIKARRLPDVAIIDIIFDQAERHMESADVKLEGLYLMGKINSICSDALPIICVSAAPDNHLMELNRLNLRDRVVQKFYSEQLTVLLKFELQKIAQRYLSSIEPAIQTRMVKLLDEEDWQKITARTIDYDYSLRNLMAGWATIVLNETTSEPDFQFPDNIVETIKSMLTYA